MSTFNIYHMTKEEVVREIYARPWLLNKVAEYMLIQTPGMTKEQARYAAIEQIYSECQRSFQYNEYCKSAADAVDRVSDSSSSFMKLVDETLKKQEDKIKEAERKKKLEDARVEKLKKHCEENNLDFDVENKRYIEKQKKTNRKLETILWVSIIGAALTLIIDTFVYSSVLTIVSFVLFVVSLIACAIAMKFLYNDYTPELKK